MTWLELGDIERAPRFKKILASHTNEIYLDMDYMHQLLKCYIIGDFLQAEGFQNSVMNLMIARCKLSVESLKACTGLDSTSIRYIISNTVPDSLLRRMIYDYWVTILGRKNIMEDEIPKEYYHQLSIYVTVANEQGRKLKPPWNQDRCVYHIHRGQPDHFSCTKKQ